MEKTVYSALGESVWHGRLPNGLHMEWAIKAAKAGTTDAVEVSK